jgi:hypothetical protein
VETVEEGGGVVEIGRARDRETIAGDAVALFWWCTEFALGVFASYVGEMVDLKANHCRYVSRQSISLLRCIAVQ